MTETFIKERTHTATGKVEKVGKRVDSKVAREPFSKRRRKAQASSTVRPLAFHARR